MASTAAGISDPFGSGNSLAEQSLFSGVSNDITGVFSDPLNTNSSTYSLGNDFGQTYGNATPSVVAQDTSGLSEFTPTAGTNNPLDTSSAGTPSIGSDLSSLLSSFTGSNLGTLAEFAGLYEYESSQAGSAAAANSKAANSIANIGAPEVAAGQGLLSTYQSGELTAPYQATVNNAEEQNALSATSQKQQVTSLLANASSGNIQSAVASEGGQIDQAQALANSTAVSDAFTRELSDSMALTSAGGAYVENGITQEITSNTALQGQLSQLLGSLANAYAKSTSGTGTGTGTGSGTGSSGALGTISNLVKQLTGGSSTPSIGGLSTAGTNLGAAPGYNAADTSTTNDILNQADTNLSSGLDNFGTNWSGATDTATVTPDFSNFDTSELTTDAADATDLSSLTGSFSSAGGQAATDAAGGVGSVGNPTEFSGGGTVSSAASSTTVPGGSPTLGSTLGVIGAGLSLANEIQNPTYAGGITTANAALQAAGAVEGAGSSTAALAGAVAPYAGPVAFLASIATSISANEQRGPPVTFAGPNVVQNPEGELGSGNSIATIGNVGVGEGNNEAKGSGQLYLVNPDGSAKDNTAYKQVGQQYTNDLISAYNEYESAGGQPDIVTGAGPGYVPGVGNIPSLTVMAQNDPALAAQLKAAGISTGSLGTAPNPGVTGINNLYSASGGQAYWGDDQATFDSDIEQLFAGIQTNGGSGLELGQG